MPQPAKPIAQFGRPLWGGSGPRRTTETDHNGHTSNLRSELITPFDPCKFERVLPLTEAVYGLHEAGQEYAEELKQLSLLIGRVVGKIDVLGAFGSIGADELAKRLTIDWKAIPTDLSDLELLELVDAICEGQGGVVTLEYWIKSLALNTGDDKVSDLIYWPEQYLGDGYDERELTSAEILDIALTKRRSAENQS